MFDTQMQWFCTDWIWNMPPGSRKSWNLYKEIHNPIQILIKMPRSLLFDWQRERSSGDLTFAWKFLTGCFFTWATALKDIGQFIRSNLGTKSHYLEAWTNNNGRPSIWPPKANSFLIVTMVIWKLLGTMFWLGFRSGLKGLSFLCNGRILSK